LGASNDDGSLYGPELMREVIQAVQREHLEVTTVFAMHQGPVAWSSVVPLVQKVLSYTVGSARDSRLAPAALASKRLMGRRVHQRDSGSSPSAREDDQDV
jgi:hypothetical protein